MPYLITDRGVIKHIFLSILLAVLWNLALPDICRAEVVGHFLKLEGDVLLLKKGQLPALSPKVHDGLEPGDVIHTKNPGRAQVKFVDDTVLTIAPGSKVVIETYMYDATKGSRNAVLQVFQGLVNTVVSQAVKAQEKPNFIMKTSTAVMGVRGTQWYALVKQQSTDVFVQSGRLAVRNINPQVLGEVLVNAMQRTQIRPDQVPDPPQPFEMRDITPLQKRLGELSDKSSGGAGGPGGPWGSSGSGSETIPLSDLFASGLLPSVASGGGSLGSTSSALFSALPTGYTPLSSPESGIKTWTGGSGLWDDSGTPAGASNWTSPGAPGNGYSAYLTQTDSTNRTVSYNSATPVQLNELRVDATGSGDMTMRQDTESALAADNEYVGYNGRGTYIQTAGSNSVTNDLTLGTNQGSSGTYDLGGTGQLKANNLYVGNSGSGTFSQTGGTNTVNNLVVAQNPGSSGTYNLTGGSLSAENIQVNSGGNFNVDGGPHTVNGTVNNAGTVKTTNANVNWTGTFTNSGAYISDPGDQYFTDLIVTPTGYLVGGGQDRFIISNDFVNRSAMELSWETLAAELIFTTGDDEAHNVYIPGTDYGPSMAGYNHNFAWGKLVIETEIENLIETKQILSLYDGNSEDGGALYVGVILGVVLDKDKREVLNIYGNGFDIYYNLTMAENAYLDGKTYELQGGGVLAPAVPLPASALLFLSGLAGLGLLGRWRKRN